MVPEEQRPVPVAVALLADLAAEQLGRHREVLPGRPEELLPWKEWTCYKGMYSVTRLGGNDCTKYVDGREVSRFGGQLFPSLAETELRTPYMQRVCRRSKWSAADEEGMLEVGGWGLPMYVSGQVPEVAMACVDCTAFYLQLMAKFSTQVEYRPDSGSWAPVGGYWVDQADLRRHKSLYASIATRAWRSRTVTLWKKGNPEARPATYLYQPQAWRLLTDIAHSMAYEAVQAFGVPRVAVDEFWLPETAVEAFQGWLYERWDLQSKVKHRWTPRSRSSWPLKPHNGVRELSAEVRGRLVAGMTGAGPRDPMFAATVLR